MISSNIADTLLLAGDPSLLSPPHLFLSRRGKMSILVATAVAARGLDIKGVAHVVVSAFTLF